MFIGLGLTVCNAQQQFNPSSLFAAGEQGAWYDPSDFSTQFQDSAGTTPVTAVGQPVGKVLDKSGRGNHLIQATAASRPVLQQDASGFYWNFDGVDDNWVTAASIPFTAATMTLWAGVRSPNNTLGILAELSADINSNPGGFFFSANDGQAAVKGSTAVANTTNTIAPGAAPVSNVFSVAMNCAGATIETVIAPRRNAVAGGATGAATSSGLFATFPLYVGRRGGASLPFNGQCYQLILRGTSSTAAQIAAAERYVGSKMGIPL